MAEFAFGDRTYEPAVAPKASSDSSDTLDIEGWVTLTLTFIFKFNFISINVLLLNLLN
jgi:hypothetical protein